MNKFHTAGSLNDEWCSGISLGPAAARCHTRAAAQANLWRRIASTSLEALGKALGSEMRGSR
jgi:hypothetical protein